MLRRLLSSLGRAQPAQGGAAALPSGVEANPLAAYFFGNRGRLIHKWHHYFEIYHRHFAAFRGASPVVLEIGVSHGGSLQMWREYFGPGCRVVGVDVEPLCRRFEDETTTILIGDQADRAFLASIRERFPRIDIIIDDGGHRMTQQIATLEELYPHLQPRGVYLCEDVQTSFWPEFGGGAGREGTFLEHAKQRVDELYGWHSKQPERLRVTPFTESTYGLHFYDSIVVIEKRPMTAPVHSRTGFPSF